MGQVSPFAVGTGCMPASLDASIPAAIPPGHLHQGSVHSSRSSCACDPQLAMSISTPLAAAAVEVMFPIATKSQAHLSWATATWRAVGWSAAATARSRFLEAMPLRRHTKTNVSGTPNPPLSQSLGNGGVRRRNSRQEAQDKNTNLPPGPCT